MSAAWCARRLRRSLDFFWGGGVGGDFNGAWRVIVQEAKIARARIGSAMPMMNENWSYSKHAEALIRIGACAATVIERDDGRSLFLQ